MSDDPVNPTIARLAQREAMRREAAELYKNLYLTPLERIERQISEQVTAEALARKQRSDKIID